MQKSKKSWIIASGLILTVLLTPVLSIIPVFFFSAPIRKAYYLRGYSFGCFFIAFLVGIILFIFASITVPFCNDSSYHASIEYYNGTPKSSYRDSACYVWFYYAAAWLLGWSAVGGFTFFRSKAMIQAAGGAQPDVALQQQFQPGTLIYVVTPGQVAPATAPAKDSKDAAAQQS